MTRAPGTDRERLLAELNREVPAFQDATYAVDEAAAAVLALTRDELRCLDHLRDTALGARELAAATGLSPAQVSAALRRLELAGYVQRAVARTSTARFEITSYAQEWIRDLWQPIHEEAVPWLHALSAKELATVVRFLRRGRELQHRHAARIRRLLEDPRSRPRPERRRGGLSPAALRRVQLFVHAHLDRPIPIRELAQRAGLSAYHFARAFRVTTGETPRAFVERLRIGRAEELLRDPAISLAQVAIAAGFGTQSSFTTAFRRATGFTPAQYRRNAAPRTPPGARAHERRSSR